jgi:hypothetical protein
MNNNKKLNYFFSKHNIYYCILNKIYLYILLIKSQILLMLKYNTIFTKYHV